MSLADVTVQMAGGYWINHSGIQADALLSIVTTGTNPYSCARVRLAAAYDERILGTFPFANQAANDAYVWVMFWWWCPALAAGESAGIWGPGTDSGGKLNLLAVYNAGGFTVNLRSSTVSNDTGTTAYATGTSSPHLFIVRYNTSTQACDVWIDHVLELSATTAGSTDGFVEHWTGWNSPGGVDSNVTGNRDWAQFVQATSPNADDIDPTTMYPEVLFMYPDGDGDIVQFGDHTDCTAGSTTGSYAHWDDWAAFAANDGDTTNNCGASNATEEEISTLTAPTFANTILGVQHAMLIRQGAAVGKVINHDAIIRENSTSRKVALGATIPVTYTPELTIFHLSPDGSPWDQTIINALQGGVGRAPTSPESDIRITALALEAVAIGTVAPSGFEITLPGAGDRRRLLSQVI